MPRKSSQSLTAPGLVAVDTRPNPPEVLTQEEAEIWCRVVDTKPANWFDAASAPILTEYCRAVAMSDYLTTQCENSKADPATFIQYVKLRHQESMRVASLGTKLRLTQQSRYTPGSAKTADKKSGEARPWLQSA